MQLGTAAFNKSRGFTLLEVLLAISILAIGMLGIAAIHLMSLKDNRDAYLRSQAVLLTNDITERMRNNKSQVYANAYNDIDTSKVTAAPDLTCFTSKNGCTPAQITAIDIAQWSKKINTSNGNIALLPAAKGTVKLVTDNIFTIEISWQLEKSSASSYSIKIAI